MSNELTSDSAYVTVLIREATLKGVLVAIANSKCAGDSAKYVAQGALESLYPSEYREDK